MNGWLGEGVEVGERSKEVGRGGRWDRERELRSTSKLTHMWHRSGAK